MTEEWCREIAAQAMAHEALIEALLKFTMRGKSPAEVQAFKDAVLSGQDDTSAISGAFPGDDVHSEAFADLVVLVRQRIAELISRI